MTDSPRQQARFFWQFRPNTLTSIVLLLPLLVLYELGVVATDVVNGADIITGTLMHFLGFDGFLITQLVLLAVFVAVVVYLRQAQQFSFHHLARLFTESAVYAISMGFVIVTVMIDLLGIDPRLAISAMPMASSKSSYLSQLGFSAKVVLALGAGLHEELVFRLILMGGIHLFLHYVIGMRRLFSIGVALVFSAMFFSIAHHIGPLGEPLRSGALVYRWLAGMIFGLLFQLRGLVVAVYTHVLYDLYIFFVAMT